MDYLLLTKYNVDIKQYRVTSHEKMEKILLFCEKNKLTILNPPFVKKGEGRSCYVRYSCKCGNSAESAVTNFFNKTVYACKKCNAGLINQIFKPIKTEKIINLIKKKGFKVISYNHTTRLDTSEWVLECKFGHVFTKKGNKLNDNLNYCPDCWVESAEEYLMRILIEAHFKKKFPKVKPNWLISAFTNRVLELDMYNEELKLAFEYHGPQHYLPIYGEKRLLVSKRNDLAKRNVCKSHNVTLIEMPYISVKAIDNLIFFTTIAEKLRQFGFDIDQNLPEQLAKIDFDFNINNTQNLIDSLKKILKKSNKIWISGNYVNVSSIIKIKCNNCKNESEHKIKGLLNLKNNPTTYCHKCPPIFKNHKTKAIKRHTTKSKNICRLLNLKFSRLQFNSYGYVSGFWYLDSDNNEKLFGIKRYKKHQ